jgi:hypothetical protein
MESAAFASSLTVLGKRTGMVGFSSNRSEDFDVVRFV